MSVQIAEPAQESPWLDEVLASVDDGICVVDADGRIVAANPSFVRHLGIPPPLSEAGRPFADLARHLAERQHLGAEHVAQLMVDRLPRRGGVRPSVYEVGAGDQRVVIQTRPLSDGGSVHICRQLSISGHDAGEGSLRGDVTEIERLEATVAELNDELRLQQERLVQTARDEKALREYAAKLERSNRELQDFASIASHDLQEPLRKIEAFGQRLHAKCGDELGDAGKMYVDRMQNAAGRMRVLIDDLLTYSRVSTKANPFEAIDLGTIVGEVLCDLQVTLEQADGRVEVGAMPTIDADPTQMRQLIQNLLTNALKFRHEGIAPVVRVDGRLLPAAEPDALEQCEIRVADNGIGFEDKYADRIFGIFQRLHGRNEYEGTGIGLATCRKIVERHGGTIVAASTPGEGATFTFTLPVRQPAGESEP